MPEVTVIIPTYNREKLVTRAIDSVLNQTFKDFELIIVDDGSTDHTVQVIKNYRDERINLFIREKNKGANAARNIGIENSSGNYIAFLDSDDEWLPTKLEKQLELFNSTNLKNLGAVGCGRKIYIEKKGVIETKDKIPKKTFGNIYEDLLKGKVLPATPRWPGGTPMIMIKRECFKKVGNFDPLLESAQDHELYIRLAKFYQFAAVPEPLVNVYQHSEERISSSSENQIAGQLYLLHKHQNVIPVISYLRGYYFNKIGWQYMKKGDLKNARKYLFKSILAYPLRAKNYYHFIRSFA